jgi:hypothetical protein
VLVAFPRVRDHGPERLDEPGDVVVEGGPLPGESSKILDV